MAKLTHPARKHRLHTTWTGFEARMRASFVSTRDLLKPYLVPHRFEGTLTPESLKRAEYGYGIALNKSYVGEIMGHIKGAPVDREWGPLADTSEVDPDGTPKSGMARAIHADATLTGKSLAEFMTGEVLEWYLTSLGGFIVADAPPHRADVATKKDETAAGVRPYLRFIPLSAVVDLDTTDFSWLKVRECIDNRTPDGEDKGEDIHHVLYQLLADGTSVVGRYNKDGVSVNIDGTPAEPVSLGRIVDTNGTPIIPVVPVKRGTHPQIPFAGTGIILGLDDIVIDLFNVTSEMREAFRDAAFSMFKHRGPDGENVRKQMVDGTRLALLGESPDATLERVSGDASEVAAGITLIELGVKNWALSAKRQAAEAMAPSAGADSSSGTALSAEFQLDLKPLLVSIVEAIDSIETNALFIMAQLAGVPDLNADKLRVTRGVEFRLEDEAARITRLVGDFVASLDMTPTMKVQISKRWLEAADVLDLSEKIDKPATPAPVEPNADGTTPPPTAPAEDATTEKVTVGEQIEKELWELSDAQHTSKVNEARMAPAAFSGGQ